MGPDIIPPVQPAPPAPPAPPETAVSVEDQFQKLVNDTYTELKAFHRSGLEFYYHLGERAKELTDSAQNYGNRTIEQFVDALNAKGSVQLKGTSTVYKAKNFFESFTKEEFEKAVEAGLSWRNVIFLVKSKVTPELRQSTLNKVAEGEITQDKIKEEIRSQVTGGGGTPPPAPAPKPMAVLKNTPDLFDMCLTKIQVFGDSAKQIFQGDDLDNMKTAKDHLEAADAQWNLLNNQWQAQMKKAKAALTKVEGSLE